MRYFYLSFILLCASFFAILGMRGTKFSEPPLYIFPDMDTQSKYKPQRDNTFFPDHADDRPPVPNAVCRGNAHQMAAVFSEEFSFHKTQNPLLYSGQDQNAQFITEFPIPVTPELMQLGQHKFAIFCTPCHGASGDGNGITKKYGMIATASYHDDRLRKMPIGEIFNTISHGKGQMSSYADKLSPEERWAVILYIRALQRSQNATVNDIPENILHTL